MNDRRVKFPWEEEKRGIKLNLHAQGQGKKCLFAWKKGCLKCYQHKNLVFFVEDLPQSHIWKEV